MLILYRKRSPNLAKSSEYAQRKIVDENQKLSEHLPVLKCECGAEILLLPDLKFMNHAIETHVAEHRKKEKDPRKAAATASRIRQILIEQLLKKASETNK
jgi:hypothetical protein